MIANCISPLRFPNANTVNTLRVFMISILSQFTSHTPSIMVDVSDDLAAVQVALNEAQESLQGLELAVSLQRQEFFQDASSDSSVGSSAGEDSLEELKLAIEAQVSFHRTISTIEPYQPICCPC